MRYLEFACASNFSFLRGASHPEELMVQAAHLGLAGLGFATAIRWPAWCARIWPSASRTCRLPITRARGWCSPTARRTFSPIRATAPPGAGSARLLTLGNLRAEKGDCILHLDDLLAHGVGLELVVIGFFFLHLSPGGRGRSAERSG